jgi:acetyl esterase/lipase
MTPERIEYGDDPSQFVELTRPEGEPRGVVVVIHGGFWRAAYDLELGRPLAADLARRGWAALNVEYRRVGNGGGVPETLDDVRAAIGTLRDTGLDLGRVVTLGHSAGGHLATWAGGRVQGVTHVISQAGVVDLVGAERDGLGAGATSRFLGHDPGPADSDVDPLQQVPLAVPVWCVHGTDDTDVPIVQSRTYVDAARAAGGEAELVEVEGNHFVVIDTGSDAWRRTVEILDSIG